MAEKQVKTRIVNKHDTEANWILANSFVPKQGELIVYDVDDTHTYERFKIGDGVSTVNSLPFSDANKANASDLSNHINNTSNPHSVTKSDIGLSNVENKSSETIRSEITSQNITDALGYTPVSGVSGGSHDHAVADIDGLQSALDSKANNENGIYTVTTTGTGDNYIANVPNITALTAGVSFIMIPHASNTVTIPTLNVNNLGVKDINRVKSSDYSTEGAGATGWLTANTPIRLMYNGQFWVAEGIAQPVASDIDGAVRVCNGGTGADNAPDALRNLGLNATATEINHISGATSNIQTQINSKADTSHSHSAAEITSGAFPTDVLPTIPISKGGTGAVTAEAARTNLGVAGYEVIAGTPTTSPLSILYGGTGASTAAGARNNLGLGNTNGPLPVENGGTGASTLSEARENLGVAPAYQYSTVDLEAGVSPLETGKLYFVYEV